MGEEAHLLIGAVRWESHGRTRNGVASIDAIERRGRGTTLPIYLKPNPHFRLPADPAAPIVMIGPGTGVAPFRAFLQHREATGAQGRNWLLFGARRFTHDFLYQLEWQDWLQSGLLTRIDVAFSRDQRQKIYVQHRMWDARRELLHGCRTALRSMSAAMPRRWRRTCRPRCCRSSPTRPAAMPTTPPLTCTRCSAPAAIFGMFTDATSVTRPTISQRDHQGRQPLAARHHRRGATWPETGGIAEDDQQLTKFHGIYQQDDRDLRAERGQEEVEKAFIFMARMRIPGGVLTPAQWLALHDHRARSTATARCA